MPPQCRKRSRAKRGWYDEIDETMETMFARSLKPDTCQDRKEWRLGMER